MLDISREMLRNLFQMTVLVTGSSMSVVAASAVLASIVVCLELDEIVAERVHFRLRRVRHEDGRTGLLDQGGAHNVVAAGNGVAGIYRGRLFVLLVVVFVVVIRLPRLFRRLAAGGDW